jgi:hypothetical protein
MVAAVAIFCGLVWITLSLVITPYDSGNPRVPRTPEQKAEPEAERRDLAQYRERKRYWIEQIKAGGASFSQAACELEQRGEWDAEANRCTSR